MKTKVTKWGNSYALRLPKHIVEALNLTDETELLIEHSNTDITLRRPSKEQQLKTLLADIQPQQELDWGEARGKEIW